MHVVQISNKSPLNSGRGETAAFKVRPENSLWLYGLCELYIVPVSYSAQSVMEEQNRFGSRAEPAPYAASGLPGQGC